MPILPYRCSGQPQKILRFGRRQHLLKGHRRKMMALVDGIMPILPLEILHRMIVIKTLRNGDIDHSAALRLAPANLPDLVNRQLQNHREPLPPLVQELLSMNQHQLFYAPRSNQRRLARSCGIAATASTSCTRSAT